MSYADSEKKKAAKEKELILTQWTEEEGRKKALQEAREIVINEDSSLLRSEVRERSDAKGQSELRVRSEVRD